MVGTVGKGILNFELIAIATHPWDRIDRSVDRLQEFRNFRSFILEVEQTSEMNSPCMEGLQRNRGQEVMDSGIRKLYVHHSSLLDAGSKPPEVGRPKLHQLYFITVCNQLILLGQSRIFSNP